MNLGRELVACALREGTLKAFTEAGISHEWLTDEADVSRVAIFPQEDMDAWMTLFRHWEDHGKIPSVDMFRRSHPAQSYELPGTEYTPGELIGIFREDRQRYLSQVASSDIADLVAEGRFPDAVDLMDRSARLIRETYESHSVEVDWDGKDYDVEGRINRTITQGIRMGIDALDTQFPGFQPGNLITYLGRAKAGKTSFAILSALTAWDDGKRVLFVSFEIAAGKDPNEPGISDRLDSFGARVDLIHYMMGELTPGEKKRLRDFRATFACDATLRIVQPTRQYTVSDLEADIDRHKPDVVYVDGFYFMTDRSTGKRGGDWEGHDGLAAELKSLALARMIPVVATHQVREKQLQGKKGKGIDDGAMMGGTGLIMASDMVFGYDIDDEHVHTIGNTRARLRYLDAMRGKWDWATCTFSAVAPAFDEEQFGNANGDLDAPF